MDEKVPRLCPRDTSIDAERARSLASRVAATLGLTVDAHDGGDFDVYASPAAGLTGDVRLVTREHRHVAVIDIGGRIDIDVALCRVEATMCGEPEATTLAAVAGSSPRLRTVRGEPAHPLCD